MQLNEVDFNSKHIVCESDKAAVNRRWTELFECIQELPGDSTTEDLDENPLVHYVYGHRQLDAYLDQLRSRLS